MTIRTQFFNHASALDLDAHEAFFSTVRRTPAWEGAISNLFKAAKSNAERELAEAEFELMVYEAQG